MRKLNVFALLLFFVFGFAHVGLATKIIPFADLLKPASIKIDNDRVFITEGATVSIYSFPDFKLKKKFGKKGEGPGEFQITRGSQLNDVDIRILPDRIMVNSRFKISYFTKDGKFIGEKKPERWAWLLVPVGKNFVGRRTIAENNIRYHTLWLIDQDLKKAKEIFRERAFFQVNKSLDPINRLPATFYSYQDKLFVDEKYKGIIHVYDSNAKELYTISHPFKRVKVTEAHKKRIIDFYLSDPIIRPQYEASKHLVKFSDKFPLIWDHLAADDKVYVLSHEEEKGKLKFYIFDLKGKFLKAEMMPLKQMTAESPYPYAIHKGKLYQMVENFDTEQWELHITSFSTGGY